MSATPIAVQQATILQQCKVLHLPTVGGQCGTLAAHAVRERPTQLRYLEALLAAEVDGRERHASASAEGRAPAAPQDARTSLTSPRRRRSPRRRSASLPTAITLREPSHRVDRRL